jgi:methylated-DNA-[protein]-cysteine S-methyltransferase
MFIGYYKSSIGIVEIHGNDSSIISIDFVAEAGQSHLNDVVIKCIDQLEEYFSGKREAFEFSYLLSGTDFQKKVWEYLLTIPYGTVQTYKEVAINLGNPKAVRAVANAIGSNKHLVFIPCHRVIGSNGSLTGFRAGLECKDYLLKLEGVVL